MKSMQFKRSVMGMECVVTFDTTDPKEVFQQMQFWFGDLPTCGPKGGDVVPSFRKTPKGDYYSLLCVEEKMEFKLGQKLEGGELFPKGWEPMWEAGARQGGSQAQAVPPTRAQQPTRESIPNSGVSQEDIDKVSSSFPAFPGS